MPTPKRPVKISPSRKIKLTPGKEGKLLPEEGKFAVYGKKKPRLLPRKGGRVSTKGGAGALNRYYAGGGRRVVEKIYSRKYRVVRAGEGTYAVRIAGEKLMVDGQLNERAYGWISEEGQLTTAKDFRDTLTAIENTTAALESLPLEYMSHPEDWHPLTSLWDSLTQEEKARVVSEFRNFDWAAFWNEMYPVKGEADISAQLSNYDEIVARIEHALSR